MPKPSIPRPTDAELAILRVLWKQGPSTVRQVHELLHPQRKTGYTTTLKLMQIMAKKGLVRRDESAHRHVYQASGSQDQTRRRLIGDLLTRAFDGSAAAVMMNLLETAELDAAEIVKLRALLDRKAGED